MTKSRTLPALLLLVLAAAASRRIAQTGLRDEPPLPRHRHPKAPTIVTADEAVAMSRAQVRDVVDAELPAGGAGRRGRRLRPPRRLPALPRALAGARREPGHRRARGRRAARRDGRRAASAARRSAATRQCGGGFDIFGDRLRHRARHRAGAGQPGLRFSSPSGPAPGRAVAPAVRLAGSSVKVTEAELVRRGCAGR